MFCEKSLVSTEDGWVINTSLPNKVLDINLKPQSFKTEKKQIKGYKIILSNGQKIEVSEGHLLRMYDKLNPYDVPVDKVELGTQLGIKRINTFKNSVFPIYQNLTKIDKDFVYIFGCMVATGMDTLNETPTFLFNSQRTDYKFIRDFFSKWDPKAFVNVCKQITNPIEELFNAPREVVLAFLSGLIGPSGTFRTSNLALLHHIANLMAFIGLKARLSWQTFYDGTNHYQLNILEEFGLDTSYFSNLDDIYKFRKRKEVHGWIINKEDLITFKGTSNNINSYISGKTKTLSKSAIECIPIDIEHKGYFPVTIISKESTKVNGISIGTETGRYICMGLNTHD